MPEYVPIQDLTIVNSIDDSDMFPFSDGSGAYAVRGSTIKSYAAADAAAAAADAALSKTAAQNAASDAAAAQSIAEEAASAAESAGTAAETATATAQAVRDTVNNAFVKINASFTWEEGGINSNGGNSTASDRVRTPANGYFTPNNCIENYLTIVVSNPDLEVKIQEYIGTPSASTATGRYSAFKGETFTFSVVDNTRNFRLCARYANGGDIDPDDIADGDIAVYWHVAADENLTLANKPADAQSVGRVATAFGSYLTSKDVTWESGYLSRSPGGTEIADTTAIRTMQYLRVGAGTAVYSDDGVSFAVWKFSTPSVAGYIERTDAVQLTNKWLVIPSDCYIRIAGNYKPAVAVTTDEEIAALAGKFHIVLVPPKQRLSVFGAPEFYLSEATADTETSLNNATLTDLYAIYDNLCSAYPETIQRLPDLGMDASNTYAIREYRVNLKHRLVYEGEVSLSGDLDIDNLDNLWTTQMDNPVIGLNIGIHGNEKAPTWGAALAIKEIVESDDDFATFLKTNFDLRIIPCSNPYGFTNNQRRNANNVDINRNFDSGSPQAETTILKNWTLGISDKAALIISIHGTTGYYAYYSVPGVSPYYADICEQCAHFTAAIQRNWAEFYGVDKAPYCYTVKSVYDGTYGRYQNRINIPGYTLETPQNYANGDVYVWDNDLRSCKLTKDLLINAMQASGAWAARIGRK